MYTYIHLHIYIYIYIYIHMYMRAPSDDRPPGSAEPGSGRGPPASKRGQDKWGFYRSAIECHDISILMA